MLLAAKEKILSSLAPWCAETCISEHESEGKKTHQGVATKKLAHLLGHDLCNSTTALGLRGQAVLNRSGSRCTGKERDAESGLDYFGVRYYSNAMGRWLSPDPKQFSKKHLAFPQRWNKYSYVQNDPLGSIDPDGLEDYKVFLAAPQAGGNWDKAAAVAKANGHTLQVFQGKDASVGNFNAAVMDQNNRVIVVGHTSHDPSTGQTTAVVLGDGRSAGMNSTTQQVGPVDAHGTASVTETPNMATFVNADTVAIFGCQSIDLGSAFSGASNFVGMDSGTDHLSTFPSMSAGAEAFVEADAAARPAGTGGSVSDAPVNSSNQAFQQNRRNGEGGTGTDFDGDRVVKRADKDKSPQ